MMLFNTEDADRLAEVAMKTGSLRPSAASGVPFGYIEDSWGTAFNRRAAMDAEVSLGGISLRLSRLCGLFTPAVWLRLRRAVFAAFNQIGRRLSDALKVVGTKAIHFSLLLLILAHVSRAVAAEPSVSSTNATANPFVWDAQVKRIKMDGMSKLAVFTFWVTNTASADAAILSTETSCDCTVAQLPSQPWLFKPGQSGSLAAKLNVTGKFGLVTNQVAVRTTHGRQLLTVIAEIPLTPAPFNTPARERDRIGPSAP